MTDNVWCKSVSRRLAIRCLNELKALAENLTYQNNDTDDDTNVEENIYARTTFSKHNVDELFKVMMTDTLLANTGNDPSEHIIVWKTTPSRRNRLLGKYCSVNCNTREFQLNGESNEDAITCMLHRKQYKKEFIQSNLKMKITNIHSYSAIYMNLDLFLTHVLIYKESGNNFSLEHYNQNIMQQVMESEYFSQNQLHALITDKSLVKTAKKSLGGGGAKRGVHVDTKKKTMIEILLNYDFNSNLENMDLDEFFFLNGYEGLLNLLLTGLDTRVIHFITKNLEIYVR